MKRRNRTSGLVGTTLLLATFAIELWAQAPNAGDVERGRYLTRVGDCVACRTAPGGKPFAGGLPMQKSLPKVAADARQTATSVCSGCHGADGNSIRTDIPSLAQQGADYLYDQLTQFKAQGHRRASGVMGAMAVNLTPE